MSTNAPPHGLEFNKPVSLDIGYTDKAGETFHVLRLSDAQDDSWDIEQATSFEASVASLDVEHFSFFTVVYEVEKAISKADAAVKDAGIEDTSADAGDGGSGGSEDAGGPDDTGKDTGVTESGADSLCADFSFTPCGGDLVGKWEIVGICFDYTRDTNPLARKSSSCNDAVYDIDIRVTGTSEFTSNGSFTRNIINDTRGGHFEVSDACLQGLSEFDDSSKVKTCDDIIGDNAGTCTHVSGLCTCDATNAEGIKTGDKAGTYTTSGTTWTAISGEDSKEFPYCVNGDTAVYRVILDGWGFDDDPGYLVLRKN